MAHVCVPLQMYVEVLYCLAVDITACPPTGAVAGEQALIYRKILIAIVS